MRTSMPVILNLLRATLSPAFQRDASNLPKPWIAPATLPRRIELQIMAFIQVTTVVSILFKQLDIAGLPQPPQGI